METTKPRTVSSIGMFDMLKGAGMLAIVLGHTAELYPLQLSNGLSLTAFLVFVYRETLTDLIDRIIYFRIRSRQIFVTSLGES